MLHNYLKIAIRNLRKNSVYSFINISGLSIGIASSVLILLWVADEYSYDTFHKNYNSIYKLYQSQEWQQGIGTGVAMPYPLKEVIKNRTNAIKHVVMTNWGEGNMLEVGEKRLNKLGLSASEDFFKVFSFDMIKGDPNTALNDPSSIVITESTAQTLFENRDPINQLIKIDNGQELKVTGVIKDLPKQTFSRIGLCASLWLSRIHARLGSKLKGQLEQQFVSDVCAIAG
ncbi:MAG: ABC transporter permease [Cytophagales bacterium]|nr:ABC transporter permease [Cytophagales bacterium]